MTEEITIQEFIANHRKELTEIITELVPNTGYISSEEIEDWIWNNELLYNWANDEGVDV